MNRAPNFRRFVPVVVVVAAVSVAAVIYHREVIEWFGGDPDSMFGAKPQSTPSAALGELHAAGPFEVAVSLDPKKPVVGKNRITAIVQTANEPVSGATVRATAEMPAMGGMPAMRAASTLSEKSPGRYSGELELSMAGGWPLALIVESSPTEKAELRFDMATTIEGLRLTSATPARSSDGEENKASLPAAGESPINVTCPIRGEKVPSDAKTVTWNGHTIGFCCPPCEEDWNKLPDEKKQAFVHDALRRDPTTVAAGGESAVPAAKEGVAHWTCSMHPSVKSNDPGTCPICKMDLTAVTHQELQSGVIFVDARRRQLIGVRTATVQEIDLVKSIRALGIVSYDETRLTDVTLKFRGWIGEIHADYTGKKVRAGEPLFTIYGPELLSAQQEYLDARSSQGGGARAGRIVESARTRLLLWDLTEGQIDELARRGKPLQYVPFLSPASGTVIEKMGVRGSSIEPGKMVYRLADLSRLWVEAEIYENEIPLVEVGREVEISVSYLPGKRFEGAVSYVYPYLDRATRRGRIRVEVDNSHGELKPEMYADVLIKVPLGKKLAVPEEALLYGGENTVVFVDLGEGRFKPQRVQLGVRSRAPGLGMDFVEIREGLEAGDKVVSSGNFLIASESKLKSGIDRW